MKWSCVIAALAFVIAHDVNAQSVQARNVLDAHHGTLMVVVLETNQIVIASDSRVTAQRVVRTNSFEDGVEKVIPLSRNIAFFSTGTGKWVTHDATNSLDDLAKELVSEKKKENREVPLAELAAIFKTQVSEKLSRLTMADIAFLHSIAARDGGSIVFQSVFAGKDVDAAFRVFQLTCNSSVATNAGKLDAHLSFDLAEVKLTGRQSMLFLGMNKVFAVAMSDPNAPLGPLMKQVRSSNTLLAEPTAAALLAAAMREYGDGPASPVGYPLFVYVIDEDGFRMSRKVAKGQTVTFDPRAQGK